MYILPVVDKTELLAIGIKKNKKFDYVSKEKLSEENMLKWLEKQIKGEKEFVFYKDSDAANIFVIAIKYGIDLSKIGENFVFLFDALYRAGNFHSFFHEPASPYTLSKFIGYKRSENLVKQYSSLFDAKGDTLKTELRELLDAFEFIHTKLKNYVMIGMKALVGGYRF